MYFSPRLIDFIAWGCDMGRVFEYHDRVRPEWIDYNGHMQDAYYGLVFSYAVDHVQDAVGFDQAYRDRTGATIYVVEDHRKFLKEVHEGADLVVQTRVLDVDAQRFHIHQTMLQAGRPVCIAEALEVHVTQHPKAHITPMPAFAYDALTSAVLSADESETLHRICGAIRICDP